MKHLSILVPDHNSNLSSIILTYEVITLANEYYISLKKRPVFKIQLVGTSDRPILHKGFFSIHLDSNIADKQKSDLIIIPSVEEPFDLSQKQNRLMVDWINWQYASGAELASLCVGAFLLAATGLLKDKQCSTHWRVADKFKQMFPKVDLVTEKVITDEYGIYTAGGAISAMNLVLYIIEKFYDRETAIYCAKIFEIDINRNSQSPFMIFIGQKDHEDAEIKKAQTFIEKKAHAKIDFDELAANLFISRRNFDRRFKKATGNTPVEYLQRLKIETAKKSLETTRKSIADVMYDSGYLDNKAFRVAFRSITGLSPLEYRNKYNKDAVI